ncbi:conserved hypothetical protein [Vibrio cholerae RC385]|nr:conserved hypothetical protein [Vibrio cholerae RC385]
MFNIKVKDVGNASNIFKFTRSNFHEISSFFELYNARLRGWQRITQNSNTPTVTTAAQWDWKRRALTVPLEAFVMAQFSS